jgi:hypothetical protein
MPNTIKKVCIFVITHHIDYFIYFSYFKRENYEGKCFLYPCLQPLVGPGPLLLYPVSSHFSLSLYVQGVVLDDTERFPVLFSIFFSSILTCGVE